MAPPPNLQDLIEVVQQDTTTGNALDLLVTAATTVAQIEDTSDALLGYFVDRCRREGRSWSEISAALGVTKQAVHKRFAASVADQIIASIPAPTFERFTARARVVISSAALAARDAGREKVSSVHILLGLFAEPDGIAGKTLQSLGVTRDAVRAAAQHGQHAAAGQPDDAADAADAAKGQAAAAAAEGLAAGRKTPAEAAAAGTAPPIPRFTDDARLALRDALAIALELGHNYIGTEHLLLGLYPNPESPAAAILIAAGASEADARARVLEELRGYQPPLAR
jgi:ATP-dependent Clp protease ATP-binding subunit ClpA